MSGNQIGEDWAVCLSVVLKVTSRNLWKSLRLFQGLCKDMIFISSVKVSFTFFTVILSSVQWCFLEEYHAIPQLLECQVDRRN